MWIALLIHSELYKKQLIDFRVDPLEPGTELLQPVRVVQIRYLANLYEVLNLAKLDQPLLAEHFYLKTG